MSQPASFVNWVPSANPSYMIEPSAGQKTTGWVSGEAPPYQYLNWMFYILDQWTQFVAPAMTSGAPSIPAVSSVLTTTGTLTNASNQLTSLASVVGLVPGLLITGAHILPGTFIQSISGSDVTMSTKATSASVLQSVVFSQAIGTGATIQAQLQQHDTAIRTILPVGTILATFPKLAGAYVCTASQVADSAGFVLCDGLTVTDVTSPMLGATVPPINNSCFIMGLAAGGDGTGGGSTNNQLNLSHTHAFTGTSNALAHTHNLTIDGGACFGSSGGFGNVTFWTATDNGPNFSSNLNWTSAGFTDNYGTIVTAGSAKLCGKTGSITATFSYTPAGSNDSQLSSTQDIRPKYISAVYVMKIK